MFDQYHSRSEPLLPMINVACQHSSLFFYLKTYTGKVANRLKSKIKQQSCLNRSKCHFLKDEQQVLHQKYAAQEILT